MKSKFVKKLLYLFTFIFFSGVIFVLLLCKPWLEKPVAVGKFFVDDMKVSYDRKCKPSFYEHLELKKSGTFIFKDSKGIEKLRGKWHNHPFCSDKLVFEFNGISETATFDSGHIIYFYDTENIFGCNVYSVFYLLQKI